MPLQLCTCKQRSDLALLAVFLDVPHNIIQSRQLPRPPVSCYFAAQILGAEKPTSSYLIDDASAINKTTKKAVNDRLKRLEIETGYRVTAVTVRKLEVEADAFVFTDRLIEGWCVP